MFIFNVFNLLFCKERSSSMTQQIQLDFESNLILNCQLLDVVELESGRWGFIRQCVH